MTKFHKLKSIFTAVGALAFIAGASQAQEPPAASTGFEVQGWMKAYAEGDLPEDAVILMPETYETILETEMRAAIAPALEDKGYRVVSSAEHEAGLFVLSYDAEVTERGVRRLPESPIGVTQDPGDAARNELGGRPVDPGFAPSIRLNRNKGKAPEGPFVDLKITIRDETRTVWTAYARSEIGASTRSAVTRAVSVEMLEAIGRSVTEEDARFDVDGG